MLYFQTPDIFKNPTLIHLEMSLTISYWIVHYGLEANRIINIIATLQLFFSSIIISHPNQIPKPSKLNLISDYARSPMSVDII